MKKNMNVGLAILFYIAFTLYKFDAFTADLFTQFLGATNKDYINIQWFLAWDLKHLLSGFGGYWNAPFYTPHAATLGLGDHVLGQSVLTLVPYLLTHNTVFCYNVLFLLTFVLTGVTTFVLFGLLTDNKPASFLASIAFTFCQFRYSILAHTYVLAIYPFVLFLIFGHLFLRRRQERYLALATVSLIWQVLCSMNMGLMVFYLSLFFYAFHLWADPDLRQKRIVAWILGGHLVAGLVFLWVAMPNLIALRAQELSWRWGDTVRHSSNWGNLLTVAPTSVLSQPWMDAFYKEVETLRAFPGFFTLALVILAWRSWKTERTPSPQRPWRVYGSLSLLLGAIGTGIFGVAVFFLPVEMSIEKKINLSGWSVFLFGAAVLLNIEWRENIRNVYRRMPAGARFYAVLTVLTFLFSFALFFKLPHLVLPGFSGVRTPIRLLEFFQLGLCALAAFGLAKLIREMKSSRRARMAATALLVVFTLENVHSNLPQDPVPPLPASHLWIMENKEKVSGIIELPFPPTIMDYKQHADYVYWTTFHWTRTAHGYSSLFPRSHQWMGLALARNPFPPVDYLRALGISHVICHWNRMDEATASRIKTGVQHAGLMLEYESDGSSVYALPAGRPLSPPRVEPLPAGSRVETSVRAHRAALALDGDRKTAWKTGRAQQPGDWVRITLPQSKTTAGLVMYLGKNFLDLPHALRVEGFSDGHWVTIADVERLFPDAEDFLSIVETPSNPMFTVRWPPAAYSGFRITLLKGSVGPHWSIAELGTVRPD